MNYDVLIGLLAAGSGVGLTLTYQNHLKAQKALREAQEAVANADALSDLIRKQHSTLTGQLKAHMDVFVGDLDKRHQKLETRVEEINSRLAALQIKR